MIRQDCEELKYSSDLNYEGWACKLFLCFYFAEQVSNLYWDIEKIAKEVLILINKGYVKCDLGVYGHENTLEALKYLGVPAEKVREEGPEYLCKKDELEMLDLRRMVGWHEIQHFVAGDGKGNYSWDSLGIRPQQRKYKVHSKRIITLKAGWYEK